MKHFPGLVTIGYLLIIITPICKRYPTLHHAPCRLKDVNPEAEAYGT